MGIQRTIHFPANTTPDWPSIATRLAAAGETPILRMIDNLPAFPDETPPDDWQELRVGLTGGMVTLRRTGPGEFVVVTWGTADPVLERSRDTLCQAVAAAGNGTISE